MSDTTQSTSLTKWLDFILAQHPIEIDMGLERITQVANQLDILDFPNSKVITVAGTNGKGSTCAMLESVLLKAGYSVGVYSSPHLLRFNERIRINQELVSDEQLVAVFQQIETARGNISLSFFEYTTLAGLLVFKKQAPDVVILEVGLGGRLDATNIIDADITAITSIGLDHQEYLGSSRESVGLEKIGVCRPHKIAVIGEPEVPKKVVDALVERQVLAQFVGKDFNYQVDEQTWTFNGNNQVNNIPLPQLPLPNAATCIAIIEQAFPDIAPEIVKQGIAGARIAGRLEQVMDKPLVLLDVGHNPQAARYLANCLKLHQDKRIHAICGMLKDKDVSSVIQELDAVIEHWAFIPLPSERSANVNELTECVAKYKKTVTFENMSEAWQQISQQLDDEDVVIVFGSFYTVAEFYKLNLD